LAYLFLYGKMTINWAKTNRIWLFELNRTLSGQSPVVSSYENRSESYGSTCAQICGFYTYETSGWNTFAFYLFPNSWYIGCFVGLWSSATSQMAGCHFAVLVWYLLESRWAGQVEETDDPRFHSTRLRIGLPTQSTKWWPIHISNETYPDCSRCCKLALSFRKHFCQLHKNYNRSAFWIGSQSGQ
jgi:hypothetical protein